MLNIDFMIILLDILGLKNLVKLMHAKFECLKIAKFSGHN